MTRRSASSASPRRGARPPRLRSVLGIPIPLILVALLLSALLGLQLATALEASTASHDRTATAVDASEGSGKNSSGLAVVTEMTVGKEVERLVSTGTIQPTTSFDAAQCLKEQGIQDSVLIIEEIAWNADETSSWLLVHGPTDQDTLRANGGTVSATIVTPSCGTSTSAVADPGQNRLWSGHVMIGSP